MIEFYRSPEEKKWTDTGPNVPHYPALSGIWWSIISEGIKGDLSPQATMTKLATEQDKMMAKLSLQKFAPELHEPRSREYWLNQSGAPKAKRPPEEPKTIPYQELLARWRE